MQGVGIGAADTAAARPTPSTPGNALVNKRLKNKMSLSIEGRELGLSCF
jgi:hypothetical protein